MAVRMHLWDNLICYGLCLLPWFSFYLKVLKALIRFVQDERKELISLFKKAGFEGTAAILRTVSCPPFAHWRWDTIKKVTRQIGYVLPGFKNHYSVLEPFLRRVKEGTTAKLVRIACTCSVWNTQNRFVTWYANVLEKSTSLGQHL